MDAKMMVNKGLRQIERRAMKVAPAFIGGLVLQRLRDIFPVRFGRQRDMTLPIIATAVGGVAVGFGIGAGVMYFIDPDSGLERRRALRERARDRKRQLGDAISEKAAEASDAISEKASMVSDAVTQKAKEASQAVSQKAKEASQAVGQVAGEAAEATQRGARRAEAGLGEGGGPRRQN